MMHLDKPFTLTSPPVKSAAHFNTDPLARLVNTGGIATAVSGVDVFLE